MYLCITKELIKLNIGTTESHSWEGPCVSPSSILSFYLWGKVGTGKKWDLPKLIQTVTEQGLEHWNPFCCSQVRDLHIFSSYSFAFTSKCLQTHHQMSWVYVMMDLFYRKGVGKYFLRATQ